MRIAVNLREFRSGRIGGLENVVRALTRDLVANPPASPDTVTVFAPEPEVAALKSAGPGLDVWALRPGATAAEVEQLIDDGNFSLLLCPLLQLEPVSPRIASAVWIPDIQHEFHSEFFSLDELRRRRREIAASARNASLVLTCSEFSRTSIIGRFGLSAERVVNVSADADPEFSSEPSAVAARAFEALQLASGFLLYPANLWPHKNHLRLFESLTLLRSEGFPVPQLVLTGSGGPGEGAVRAAIARLGQDDDVCLLGYCDVPLMAELYRRCRAVLYPSLFEGFGIPIVEAMRCGAPVLTSDRTSCPEIAGDAALLVDPTDCRSMADGIRRLLSDGDLRTELVEKGFRRARDFSWESTSEWTRRALSRCLGQPTAPLQLEPPRWRVGAIIFGGPRGPDMTAIQGALIAPDWVDLDVRETRRDDPLTLNRLAAGDHDALVFLRSGDVPSQNFIRSAVTRLSRCPGTAIVYGSSSKDQPAPAFDIDVLETQDLIPLSAAMVRGAAFREAGGFDVGLRHAFDYDLWLRVVDLYPAARLAGVQAAAGRRSRFVSLRRLGEVLRIQRRRRGRIPDAWLMTYARTALFGEQAEAGSTGRDLSTAIVATAVGFAAHGRHGLGFLREWIGRAWRARTTRADDGASRQGVAEPLAEPSPRSARLG